MKSSAFALTFVAAILIASPAVMAFGSAGSGTPATYSIGGFSITGYAVSCGLCIDSYSCYENCRSQGKSYSCASGTSCADCCCTCYTPVTTTTAPTTTTTTVPTTTTTTYVPVIYTTTTTSCYCDPWIGGGCGIGGCASTQIYQNRGCMPSGCNSQSRCVSSDSCICTCSSWGNSGCGGDGCGETQMYQTRTCTPSGCNIQGQCVSSGSCVVTTTTQTTTTTTVPATTTTTSCYCDPWIGGGCGIGGCASTQIYQNRGCMPSGCDSQSRCVSSASCTPTTTTTTTAAPATTTTAAPATTTTTAAPATTTTTLPVCPYNCITTSECSASSGSCKSGYSCSWECCCQIGSATTTTTVKTTTTTVKTTTTTVPATTTTTTPAIRTFCTDTDGSNDKIKGVCDDGSSTNGYTDKCGDSEGRFVDGNGQTVIEWYCATYTDSEKQTKWNCQGAVVDCSKYGSTYVCSDGACVGKGVKANPVKYGDWTIYSDLGKTSSWARIIIWDDAGNTIDTLVINQGSEKTSVNAGLTITLISVKAGEDGTISSADFTVKSMSTSTATASTPVVYGTYSIYSDLGMANTWARIIIKDASEKTIDTLVINQGESKTSETSGLKITVVAVAAKQDGTIIGTEIVVNKNTNTATPTTPVIYGEYSIYSDLGMASTWARIIIKDSAGKTVDTLVIKQGESKISETSGLEISVITVTAKQDGTIVGVDLVIKSAVTGTATATTPVAFGDYRIYSDLGADGSWARVIIKDTSGKTVDTKNVNQGESWNSEGSGLHIAVVKVRATQDGTILGVDLIVNTASTGASSTATENPVVKSVRNFYTWISGVFRQ